MARKHETWNNPNFLSFSEESFDISANDALEFGKDSLKKLRRKSDREPTGIHALDAANEISDKISHLENELNRLNQELNIDKKTGCYNERFWLAFKHQYEKEERPPYLALAFVDLNNLKAINDKPIELGGGHDAGDRAIIETGNYLKSSFRESDFVVRLHGDEFMIIMTDESPIDYDRLKGRLEEIALGSKTREPALDFSIGFSMLGHENEEGKIDEDINSTKDSAEKMMYKNKNASKNQVN